ncbi:unnamed protein product (macronuclear) [Paramecium tetraurelia]|uniref:Uncharacterized protein n=1 Tax=Paramecium tetraurelia TaxID=5888 RepID=A0BVL3_PARTE|nr:uncharacterized protein GSPATT00005826001 [Paramecium tetraurelia]CAK62580.1 unnamed protein product [Paramecium tetraurelia]|eukprot:XP_001429978.1 hypothetical protein (macronuclear) [Paramecium tetraurelia strain d4-2]
MSKINCYEVGLNQLIMQIRNQIHQSTRKNRFQIQEMRQNDFDLRSNLLTFRLNMRDSSENPQALTAYSRSIEIKKRYSLLPLKSILIKSAQQSQREKYKKKPKDLNREKLIKLKCEIRAWSISSTNQTDQY